MAASSSSKSAINNCHSIIAIQSIRGGNSPPRGWPGCICQVRWRGNSGGRRRRSSGFGLPARQVSTDPESGTKRRHHLLGPVYNVAIKRAAQAAGIEKRVTSHALRH